MIKVISLIVCIVLNAVASILVKDGMKDIHLENSRYLKMISLILLNQKVFVGLIAFGLSFISYSIVLNKIKLNIAYPIVTSGGFVMILIISHILFKESVTTLQLVGILLILVGVWFVATAIK
jgi:multidrug transporter EmrE-like cation transporter